jgi:hypothetical protein
MLIRNLKEPRLVAVEVEEAEVGVEAVVPEELQ